MKSFETRWIVAPLALALALAGCQNRPADSPPATAAKADSAAAPAAPAVAPQDTAVWEVVGRAIDTKSGLRYWDVLTGAGAEAKPGMSVAVHYVGRLEDGTIFDQSYGRGEPIVFRLGAGQVIKGWDEGIAGMRVGGRRKLVIPASLGYGPQGYGSVIPPNATLVFQVMLTDAR